MSTAGNKNAPQKEIIYIPIRFGQKDKELRSWVQTLPWGAFSFIVRDTIRAYIKKDENYVIPDIVTTPLDTDDRSKFVVKAFKINKKEDHDIYSFINNIEAYSRSYEIKRILTYYLLKDKKLGMQPAFVQQKHEKIKDANSEIIKSTQYKNETTKSMSGIESSKSGNNQLKRKKTTNASNLEGFKGAMFDSLKEMVGK